MEKRKPHYDLSEIQAQMSTVDTMYLTMAARHGIRDLGIRAEDALKIVQNLSMGNFYKAMTVYSDNRIWQDVYHAEWKGKPLYIKFQKHKNFYIVSFKEL